MAIPAIPSLSWSWKTDARPSTLNTPHISSYLIGYLYDLPMRKPHVFWSSHNPFFGHFSVCQAHKFFTSFSKAWKKRGRAAASLAILLLPKGIGTSLSKSENRYWISYSFPGKLTFCWWHLATVIPGHPAMFHQVNTKAFFDEVDADKSGSISKVGLPRRSQSFTQRKLGFVFGKKESPGSSEKDFKNC